VRCQAMTGNVLRVCAVLDVGGFAWCIATHHNTAGAVKQSAVSGAA